MRSSITASIAGVALFGTGAVAAQEVVVPEPDIRVILDAGILRQKVAAADGWRWRGEYYNGGVVCSSPDVNVELQRPDLWIRGANDLVGGTASVSARFVGFPKVYTDDRGCAALGLSAACKVDACVLDIFGRSYLPVDISCYFLGIPFVSNSFPLQLPIEASPTIQLSLPASPPDANTFAEFGTLDGGVWKPSLTPREKSVRLVQTIRAVGGRDLAPKACAPGDDPRTCDDPICGVYRYEQAVLQRRESSRLVVDTSISPEQRIAAADERDAATKLEKDETLAAGHFAGVSFSRRLLEGDAQGNGLFQRILPIRLFGTRRVSKTTLEFEVIATEARIIAGQFGSRDALQLRLVIGQASAWEAGRRAQTEVKIPRVSLEGVATLPTFAAEGAAASIAVSLEGLRLTLSTKVGNASLCLDREHISDDVGTISLPLARYLGPQNLLPKCIEMGGNRMTADQTCPDGERVGRLSADRLDRNISLALDLAKATTGFTSSGRWRVSAPSK